MFAEPEEGETNLTIFFPRPFDGRLLRRGSRVRELRRHLDAALAQGRHRALPVQRLRTLPQDERHEQTTGKAVKEISKSDRKSDTDCLGNASFLCCLAHEGIYVVLCTVCPLKK